MTSLIAFVLVLAAQSGAAVENARVVNDRWPSNYDAKSWAADVFRIENAKTDEEKTLALYKWVRLLQHWGEQCGDGTRGKHVVECDAIKKINIFPFGECSDFGVTSAALGYAGGLRAKEAHVPGHVELEVLYADRDGVERSHRLDPFWGVAVFDRTASRLATWEELRDDPQLALKPSKTLLPWGDKVSDRERFAEKGACKPELRVRPSAYTMDKSLTIGETYSLRWERVEKIPFYNSHPNPEYRGRQDLGGAPRFQYAEGKPENLKFGHELLRPHVETGKNGIQVGIGHGCLEFNPPMSELFESSLHEPSKNVVVGKEGEAELRPARAGLPATLLYAVRSPYVLVDSNILGSFRAGKGDSVKVSVALPDWRQRDYTLDQVWPATPTWIPVWEAKGNGAEAMMLNQAGLPLNGEYQYLLKVEMTAGSDPIRMGMSSLTFYHRFQQNMLALPRLMPGRNLITVSAASIRPGEALRVTYRWDDAQGRDREAQRIEDRVPFTFEIEAAGRVPADVKTRMLELQVVPKPK